MISDYSHDIQALNQCVIVFARVPQKGKVKTRLARKLAPELVLNLYKNFVLDILSSLAVINQVVIIFYYPFKQHQIMQNWLGNSYPLFSQCGDNLGDRMQNAFRHVFSDGFNQALLIGTDFPDLPPIYIETAFKMLNENDAVIGPTFDGGYYLIGFDSQTFLPNAFKNITWGTPDVFEATMDRFKKNNHKVHILPKWRDIDTYEDLVSFYDSASTQQQLTASKTSSYLSSISFHQIIAKYK